ncbi:MAG: serine/threonine-protein kinase, partial [Polyangiaceae bacterium]
VFTARHVKHGNIVALKRMLPEVGEDDEAIAMFEDEARICMRLEHPHIARMLDFGHVGDRFFIAFEHVHGRDLRYVFDRSVRTKEEIPPAIVLYVVTRISEGLAYAHARKDEVGAPVSIVHRDVSPQNIVVSFDGDVKLIDFGIAKAAGRLSRTQAGAIKGKFGYMSPEQVTGREIDPRTDVFSLGICLWELLTQQRLFSGQNELIVLEKIKNLAIVPPSAVVQRLPAELDRIVLKALARDPAERYRAARELYRDLNNFCETHDFVATRAEIAQYMRRTFPEASGRVPEDTAPRSSRSSLRNVRDAAPDTVREQSPLELESSSSEKSLYGPESDLTAVRRNDEEMMNMAAEKQGGSDLDIFEGLGKKNAAQPSRQSSAPPPPPSSMKTPAAAPSAPPQVVRGDLAVGKKTLLGVQSPVGAAAPSAAPPSQRAVPAARASLPAVSAPPQKNPLAQSGSHAVPPAAETKPAAYLEAAAKKAEAKGAAVEMDWDDDEEATHVLD